MCLRESCFSDSVKVLYVVLVFEDIWKRSTGKKTSIQCVFYVLCKITEKLVQDKLASLIKKCGSFKISSMVSRFPVQL